MCLLPDTTTENMNENEPRISRDTILQQSPILLGLLGPIQWKYLYGKKISERETAIIQDIEFVFGNTKLPTLLDQTVQTLQQASLVGIDADENSLKKEVKKLLLIGYELETAHTASLFREQIITFTLQRGLFNFREAGKNPSFYLQRYKKIIAGILTQSYELRKSVNEKLYPSVFAEFIESSLELP